VCQIVRVATAPKITRGSNGANSNWLSLDTGTGTATMRPAMATNRRAQRLRGTHHSHYLAPAAALMLDMLLLSAGFVGLGFTVFFVRARRWRRMSAVREANFRRIFDDAPIGMALWPVTDDRTGNFTQVNHELSRITGHPVATLLSMDVMALTHPADRESALANVERIGRGPGPVLMAERRWLHADGSMLWVSISASIVTDGPGSASCVAQVLDITARKQAEERLTRLALYDPLTELPNRTLMRDHLVQALTRARRHERAVAVLYVDVDNFKDVNDQYGHTVGDAVLVEIAQRLRSCLRESDTAARIGGDEFVVICEDVTGESEAELEALSRRIADALNEPLDLTTGQVRLEASTGVALGYPGSNPDEIIRHADAAMYQAKRTGKARHAVADVEIVARAHRHHLLGQQLRAALDGEQLRLHYQPVLELATGRLVGVEALLRWNHPDRGLLLPGEFLDIAEERSLIIPIGEWVLRTACNQAAVWRAEWGESAPEVAINVAGRQLASHDFAERVRSAITDAGIPPHQLILEITERQMLTASHSAQAEIARLAEAGVRLSIDDFGMGYSTFEYLRRFSFGILKIDRSFIAGLGADATDSAIVRALLALSDSLQLTVIAEGIETTRQLSALIDLGCPYGQGFHLHHPGDAPSIDRLLLDTAARPAA
jgi:diguanylate cyclase (GGDEF)-like protein/PAS domain S-box-containing protein